MKGENIIPEKYVSLGFEISSFGAGSLALRHNKKAIFVFDSESEIRDEFISVICNCHLKKYQEKIRRNEVMDAG